MVTHFIVQDSAFLDLGFCILALLQSIGEAHSPESVCGILDRVSGCGGASIAPAAVAAEDITAAAASKPVTASLQRRRRFFLMLLPLLLLLVLGIIEA